jgi:ketosteroid isomerase-like protein
MMQQRSQHRQRRTKGCNLVKRLVIFSCGIVAFAGMQLVPAGSAPQSRFKNIKVLTNMADADIQKEMQGFTVALGVTCSHCHNETNFASDEKPTKEIARRMLTMVRTMNKDFLGGKAACVLCHRGSAVPDTSSSARAQQAQTTTGNPEEIVRTWFALWNALDGSEAATNKLLDLYRDDAGHEISPSERQLGPVRFQGRSHIKKMIENFAAENKEISFRLQPATANEKTFDIVHAANGPWQGPSFAVQYAAAYTTRKDNRRWMYPGAAFFEIQNGKIRNARFYVAVNERMEVFNR